MTDGSAATSTAPVADVPRATPTVVYIAGSGRSGSTLLERALGELPGFVNVGELIDLFRRTGPDDERCGCGEAFADCPFWVNVGKHISGGWTNERFAEVHTLQHQVARQRYTPRLATMALAGREYRTNAAKYGEYYAHLYRAIADAAGATCVVDASKWPVQALALSRAGIDVRVIHLVRDVRGVAHSIAKRDVERPHALNGTDVMWAERPVVTAARWTACQLQAELLARCGMPVARMRYEDFVRQPHRVIEKALKELSLSPGPPPAMGADERSIVLGPSHGLSGNPSRFRSGEVTLSADEAWRTRMPLPSRIMVTAIGLPLLVRYGRPSRSSAAPEKPQR
jgi:hypothetical protein